MSTDGLGQVLNVRDLADSRKELEITASGYGQIHVTLMPGVLGTDVGAEVVAKMADVRANAYATTRPKPKPRQES